MNLRQKYLSFAILCFFLAANVCASTADDPILKQVNFDQPLSVEFKLVSDKYEHAFKLCRLKSSHKYECTLKFTISPNKKEYGEANFKIQSNFKRAELEELIQTTKKEFETYGKFTVTLQQEIITK